jgi:phosphatidylinositol glycan class B
VLLRPTNLLIWLAVLDFSLTRLTLARGSPWNSSTLVLFREIAVCGTAVLAVSLVSDRLYFGFWTFPPYKWLYFNISQSLAVFYGHMPWHYYLSQGVPLLTTTFLPFTLVGLYKATSSTNVSGPQSNTLRTLAFATLTMITTLSLISHKEVRFIYPLLPILHILAAPYFTTFFSEPPTPTPTSSTILRHKRTLAWLLSLNLLLAGYLSLFHQPAPLSVLSFLRTDFERLHPDALDLTIPTTNQTKTRDPKQKELFALFLTPCHSTPWRSHLVYPSLRARALTCEPPLHTAPGSQERETYLDEADRFYRRGSPEEGGEGGYGVQFLAEEMWPLNKETGQREGEVPRYIVGFEGVEPVLKTFFEGDSQGQGQGQGGGEGALGREMGVKLRKVWSAWNGAFNEDWRRRGRLVVWDTGIYAGSYEGKGEEKRAEKIVCEL